MQFGHSEPDINLHASSSIHVYIRNKLSIVEQFISRAGQNTAAGIFDFKIHILQEDYSKDKPCHLSATEWSLCHS